ncbi:PspC domain-containing protein [Actinomyces sp. 432]|uniref:PspC domain-containing protein n=2 Tax=unclassified Actinomyces TaxID=2609248 RepID=UPI00137ACDD2|nr:PspC domain-containing protein [Actinomyces sp. 432]
MSEVPPPDPQARPTGPVPPPRPHGGPVPPRPAAAGFFDSLRRTGLVRTNERWIGGVAGGLARRLGLDPTLVRCVWVVLSIFSGLGLVLYGLGWALMPEESDGRIHLEQALVGDFDAGFAGAVATFVSGWVLLDHGFIPSWYITGWVGAGYYDLFWSVVGSCLVLGVVYLIYRAVRRERRQPPASLGEAGPWGTTAPGAPYPGAQQPVTPASAAGRADPSTTGPRRVPAPTAGSGPAPASAQARPASAQAAPPGAAGPQQATQAPAGPARGTAVMAGAAAPVRGASPVGPRPAGPAPRPVRPVPPPPRVPGPGRRLGLALVGIALCCLAAIVLIWSTGGMGPLAAGFASIGAVTALLGAGVIISALRGRRGGWMTGLGWLAAMVAVPLLIIGTSVPDGALSATATTRDTPSGTVTLTWDELEPQFAAADGDPNMTVDLGNYTVGELIIDLTDMPVGEEPQARAHLSLGVGTVSIRTTMGQNLRLDSRVGLGITTATLLDEWTVDERSVNEYGGYSDNRFTVDGNSVVTHHVERWRPGETATLVSPAAQDAATALRLEIEVGTGSVRVDEWVGAVTWWGYMDDAAWIVEYWLDERGNYHSELPVPGMTHAAIDTDTAGVCANAVTEALDQEADADGDSDDPDSYQDWEDQGWYGSWYSVSDLSGVGREAWEQCVGDALATEASAPAGSADTSPAPSPSPSPAPTAAPTATPAATAPEPSASPTH